MVVENQATSLARDDHDVTVVTCRHDRKVPFREQSPRGFAIRRLRALNLLEHKYGVTFPIISPFGFFTIFNLVRKSDIVHMQDVFYMSSHFTGFSALMLRKPLFITQNVALVDHPSKLVMFTQKAIYNTLGKFFFKRARKVIAYNVNVRNYVRSLGVPESNIFLNYNGIDTSEFTPATPAEKRALRKKYDLPQDRDIVLFLGRLVPKKGFDKVYHAQSPDYFTLIAGNGEQPKHMQSSENVRFFGPANKEQVRDLYRLSDVFVFPAVGEILTLVMQEAMATGLPVVTTNDKGYDDYDISKEHIRFIDRKPEVLREHITEILRNAELRQKMSQYSRQFAREHFDWSKNHQAEAAQYKETEQA